MRICRRISKNCEVGFEDFCEDFAIAHELNGKGLMLWVVYPSSRELVSVVQQMISNVVEEKAYD